MAESYRFFGTLGGDVRQYTQVEFAEVFRNIFTNGYFPTVANELAVTQQTPAIMGVAVATGEAWINGYWYKNDASLNLAISASHATLNRKDLVVLRLETVTNRTITLAIKTGTAGSSPVAPTLTQDAQTYEIALAEVYVGAGVTSILNANITDQRPKAQSFGTQVIIDDLNLKAYKANPTFTGTVVLPSTTSIGNVSATELGYLDGVTSSIQSQLNAKAPIASPTFTGTVSGITASMVGLGNVTNESKATMFTSPTFTGTVTLPSTTSIGSVSATELGYLDGVTSSIQTQISARVSKASGSPVAINNIWSGTLAQYNAIGTKDANTYYIVVG